MGAESPQQPVGKVTGVGRALHPTHIQRCTATGLYSCELNGPWATHATDNALIPGNIVAKHCLRHEP
jgi:hypothetical protein